MLVCYREDGIREILSVRIADCEDELTLEDLFSDLKDRGLQHVDMVISDGHKGIQRAMKRSFYGSSWQMCQVHLYQGCAEESQDPYIQMVILILLYFKLLKKWKFKSVKLEGLKQQILV